MSKTIVVFDKVTKVLRRLPPQILDKLYKWPVMWRELALKGYGKLLVITMSLSRGGVAGKDQFVLIKATVRFM